MTVAVLVDVIDHRGERRALARAGRSRDHDEPARTVQQLLHLVRQADVPQTEHLVGDLPQHEAVVALGLEHAHAKARFVEIGKAEIRPPMELHVLDMGIRGNREHEVFRVRGRQLGPVDRGHAAAEAQSGRRAHLQVQIGGILFHDDLQQVVHFVAHGVSPVDNVSRGVT